MIRTTRAQQLADAFYAVASANHYMVGIVERVSLQEVQDAIQILITKQNALQSDDPDYVRYDLALDLAERAGQ